MAPPGGLQYLRAFVRIDAVVLIAEDMAFFCAADGIGPTRRLTQTVPRTQVWIALELAVMNVMLELLALLGTLGWREFIYCQFWTARVSHTPPPHCESGGPWD